MNYDRNTLKETARCAVRDSRPRAWLVTLVFVLLATALPALVQGIFNPMWELMPQMLDEIVEMARLGQEPSDAWILDMTVSILRGSVIMMFLSVLFSLFAMVMSYGYRGYALRLYQGQKAGVGALFSGFPVAGTAIGTQILTGLFVFLWTLLINLVAGGLMGLVSWLFEDLPFLVALLCGVLTAVGCVLCVLAALRYCLAPYYVVTGAGLGVLGSIQESKKAMRGNYLKKLALDLSFLGWFLLLGFIIFAVVMVGYTIAVVVVGGDWVIELNAVGWDTMSKAQATEYILDNMNRLMGDLLIPFFLSWGVAWLVSLPLLLWLSAYKGTADAGFFLTVTAQRPAEDVPAPVAVMPQAPVQPAMPAQPVPPEPEAPAEDTPVQDEPEAPAEDAPVQAEPEAPAEDAPTQDEPEAPAEDAPTQDEPTQDEPPAQQ